MSSRVATTSTNSITLGRVHIIWACIECKGTDSTDTASVTISKANKQVNRPNESLVLESSQFGIALLCRVTRIDMFFDASNVFRNRISLHIQICISLKYLVFSVLARSAGTGSTFLHSEVHFQMNRFCFLQNYMLSSFSSSPFFLTPICLDFPSGH